jgi:hypothetical protein
MTNPTSNFGWQMPTPTDLVTDLPADFEVFGQAVDTSLADLQGGTTGQILAKATNADMDFAWITNDVGDITAVNVTSPITGGGSSGAVTIGINAATTSVVGAVQLSDSTSTTSSVLASTPTATKSAYDLANTANTTANSAYAPAFTNNLYAGKNAIINGDFGVAQRGASINTAATTQAYTLDRLWVYSNGPAVTTSQQATSDTTNLPFIQYCARLQRQSGQTSTVSTVWNMPLETRTSIRFTGRTVTVSFYARKSPTFTGSIGVYLLSGTGTDQSGLGGYTGQATVVNTSPSLTTTWTRYSMTGTVALTATELRVELNSGSWSGTAGAADYFEITGLQLEAGSVATPFQTASGSIGGELALCQRYYWRSATGVAYQVFGNGFATTTTVSQMLVKCPVTMRTTPTVLDTANLAIYDGAITGFSTPTLAGLVSTPDYVYVQANGTGLTANRPYTLTNNNSTSAYIGLGAEL